MERQNPASSVSRSSLLSSDFPPVACFRCRMLNISPRTLQTLRDNGTLAYSQINHKTYYRPEDVQRIVSVVEDRRKEAKFKGRTI